MTGIAACPGEGLGERDADEQGADQARPLRHRHGADVRQRRIRCRERASTTPQMSRTCWRDASSGTTPPHSRWMAVCDATMLERIAQGRAGSPVSAMSAAAVSSHDVSMASRFRRPPRSARLSGLGVGGLEDALLGDDAGDVAVGCHVERGVADARAFGREPRRADVRDLALVPLLDRDLPPSGVARSIVETGAAT